MATADEARRELARRELERRRSSVAASLPSDDLLSEARTVTGGLLEGIPVIGPMIRGGVDRAAAATLAPFSDQSYGDILKTIQQVTEDEKEANPWLDTGSQVAGAVAGTVPLVMAAPAAFGAGSAPMLARMGAGGASGGILGGLDSAVRSGGDQDAIKSGLGWGLGLGIAGAPIGSLIGRGLGEISSRVRGPSGAPAPSGAEQAFSRAAGADGVENFGPRLAALGPDAMPMDLGPNLQRQAGALAATPGRGQEIVRSAITNRQSGAGGRVSGALDDALGQPVDTVAVADDIIAKRSAAAKPLYDSAYSKPVPFTKELEDLLTRPSVSRALSKARGLAADEGIPSQQWFANIADDGAVTIKSVPDVRQLDLTKRALDDMISTAQRGGNGNEARILTQVKNRIVGIVDEAVPEYAAAREAFSGPAAVLDAIEEGQQVFSRNLTPSQLRTKLAKMGASEKEAYIQGARAEIAKTMGTARNDALAARSLFDKGWNKEKLGLIVGDKQAQKMLSSLDAEAAFTRTRDVVTGNSETAARLAAQADVGGGARAPGILEQAGNLNFGTAAMKVVNKAIGGVRTASEKKLQAELAELLTSRDPDALRRATQAVSAAQKRGVVTADRAKRITNSILIANSQQRQPSR